MVTRPLLDQAPGRLVVAWSRSATSPATAAFILAAVDVAAARPADDAVVPALTPRR
jgi:hypothetical protein